MTFEIFDLSQNYMRMCSKRTCATRCNEKKKQILKQNNVRKSEKQSEIQTGAF